MGVGNALSSLGRFVDECEERDAVTRVEVSGMDDSEATVAATLELEIDPCASRSGSGFAPSDAVVGADGTLTLSFESTSSLLPVDGHDVDVVPVRVEPAADGGTVVALRATVPTDSNTEPSAAPREEGTNGGIGTDESTVSVTVSNGTSGGGSDGSSPPTIASTRSSDVPPFRDTELLREVYETCDTFAEMPDALGMDVTAETVRRYMIRQGIHEPTSYDTGGADADEQRDETDDSESHADDTAPRDLDEDETVAQGSEELESPTVLADGIGLPDDVTIDTIVEAVQTSNTIYEVKQRIGIEREDALEMLRELNLLEFVAGRLATEAEREVSRDQIIDRLRQQADTL